MQELKLSFSPAWKYVSSDSERKYQEAVKKNVVQEQVMEKDKSDPAQWHEEIACNIADVGEIQVITDKNLGPYYKFIYFDNGFTQTK